MLFVFGHYYAALLIGRTVRVLSVRPSVRPVRASSSKTTWGENQNCCERFERQVQPVC